MRLWVCVKQVPDTETRIRIGPDGRCIDETGVNWIVSPYDEYALEEALRLRERGGEGEVAVVTVGPERANSALRTCLAMGADRAVRVWDGCLERADSLGIAAVLAAAVRRAPFDLILLGRQGVGTDHSQVGPMLAEILDLPHVNVVAKLEVGEGALRAHRQVEGAWEVFQAPLPAVVTAQKGLNEPRYASLKGIMAAKKKPLEEIGLEPLGLAAAEVGEAAARVSCRKLELPPARPGGRILEGEPERVVPELVRLLREEAKVI
ncbi:MAG: electron transfer flavoprotein subunit beta/FixA family protein [Acidobacteria bacterium]|nr:electron transfer flavoprotein subunit beta/FixA family protein [Acidobacteriota bacterium]